MQKSLSHLIEIWFNFIMVRLMFSGWLITEMSNTNQMYTLHEKSTLWYGFCFCFAFISFLRLFMQSLIHSFTRYVAQSLVILKNNVGIRLAVSYSLLNCTWEKLEAIWAIIWVVLNAIYQHTCIIFLLSGVVK